MTRIQKVQRTGSEGCRNLRKGPPRRTPPHPTSFLLLLSSSSVSARLPPPGPCSDPPAVPPPCCRAGAAAPVESRGDTGVTGDHVCFLLKSSSSYMSSRTGLTTRKEEELFWIWLFFRLRRRNIQERKTKMHSHTDLWM